MKKLLYFAYFVLLLFEAFLDAIFLLAIWSSYSLWELAVIAIVVTAVLLLPQIILLAVIKKPIVRRILLGTIALTMLIPTATFWGLMLVIAITLLTMFI